LRLFPFHLAELRASGLSDDTIAKAGIYSEHDRRRLAALLNRKRWPAKLGSAIVYPYRDEAGAVVLHRVKPERPLVVGSKSAKYLSPSGSAVRLYFPFGAHERIQSGETEVIITEGEKKSLAAIQVGFCCIALPGVDCWHARKSTALLPDLERIEWSGRTVYIAFDSDAAENERVCDNESLLAAALERRGAAAKVVRLPAGQDGAKVGLDDFLFAQSPAELRKLLDRAEPAECLEPAVLRQPACNADPGDVASKVLTVCERDGLSRLRFWHGSWWWWTDGRYVQKSDVEVRAEVLCQFTRDYFGVKSRHVSDVIEHLKAGCLLRDNVEPPAWLGTPVQPWRADECLATKSAIVHLPSLVCGGEPHRIDASPALLTLNAIDFEFDLCALQPATWLAFLDDLWGSDRQSIATLQELFGYLLVADTRQQKIFMLVGPKRSGKGTIARVLTGIVGKGNIAAPTLAGLATNFGLWPLIGKSVAIISDARLSGRADQVGVVERLLSISGEDSITIDRKNLEPVTCRLPTRFLILTNELPRLCDASGAIVSRMIVLQTTRSYYDREDHHLTERLLAERQGILLWAIDGWRRLRERGHFVQPDSSLESVAEMNDLASPVAAFIRDRCQVGPDETIVIGVLFAAWQQWCAEHGRGKLTGTTQTFARDVLAAEPIIRRRQLRVGKTRTRVYEGIGLKTE
jgi:putative DNA primase/helicase